jgi:hypothetical protein
MNLISSEEFQNVIRIRLLWRDGGQNVNDEDRGVIRRMYAQGIPEIVLSKVLRQTLDNFRRMFEGHGGSLASGADADVAGGEDDVLMPEGFGDASAARESHERADIPDGSDSGEGGSRPLGGLTRAER